MPHAYGAKAGEKTKVKELEKLGYTVIPENMIRCVECGGIYSVDQNKYWQSTSPMHKNNQALTKVKIEGKNARDLRSYIPYCKTCLLKDFDIDNMSDVTDLLYRIDIPYKLDKWNTIVNNYKIGKIKTIEGAVGCYKKDIELSYKNQRFTDSDNFEVDIINDSTNHKKKISKKDRCLYEEKWGEGYEDDEYVFLDREWHKLITSYECDSYSQTTLFEEIAMQKLDIKQRRKNNEKVDSQLKTLQDLLGSANIKPVQETGANESEKVSFGTLIKKFENENPIPEALDDEMKTYIDTYMIGHLAKMKGLKNKMVSKYEEAISKYTIDFEKIKQTALDDEVDI